MKTVGKKKKKKKKKKPFFKGRHFESFELQDETNNMIG